MLERVFGELSALKFYFMKLEAHVNVIRYRDLEDYLKELIDKNPPPSSMGPLEDMVFDLVTLTVHYSDENVQQYLNLYLKEKK